MFEHSAAQFEKKRIKVCINGIIINGIKLIFFSEVEKKILYSIASCLNYIRLYISGLINLNYNFNVPIKVSPKAKVTINGGFIFQFHDRHDRVHSKILLSLLEMFFGHFIKMNMTE